LCSPSPASAASHEVVIFSKPVCRDTCGAWVAAANSANCFQSTDVGRVIQPSPGLESTGSRFEMRLLLRVVRRHPLNAFRRQALPARVSSLIAVSTNASTFREAPSRASFRPQAFSASRRFPPRSTSRACFIPRPRPGFAVQGFSLRTAALSHRKNLAPLPLELNRCRTSRRHGLRPSTSRPCSMRRRVPQVRGLAETFGGSPHQFPPSGLHLSRRVPSYLGHPLLTSWVDLRSRDHRFLMLPASCQRESWLCPSPDLQSVRGFEPSVDSSAARLPRTDARC